MTWLAAHQGGWDEVALFVVPVVAALVLVRWAERRSRRKREESAPPPAPKRPMSGWEDGPS